MKKKAIFLLFYFLASLLFSLFVMHYCLQISKVGFLNTSSVDTLKSMLSKPFIVYGMMNTNQVIMTGFLLSFCFCIIVFMIILLNMNNNKNYKYKDKEHGSSEFAKISEMNTVKDKIDTNNRILSKNARLSLDGRKFRRNMNVCIIGGAGSGKTRFFLKPNLMQMNSSYIITDPKGEILRECGQMLKDNDYEIKVLDLVDVRKSDYYNPFAYINMENEQDIISLISFIMENTNDGQKSKDPFWDGAEKMLITAMFFYILYEGGENEKNIDTMMYLINKIDLNKKEGQIDVIDVMFGKFADKYGHDHIAVRNYNAFRNGGEKNQGSILLTNSARLNLFNLQALRELTSVDSIDLNSIGDKKKIAVFIITSPADRSLNFIAGLLYTQLFKVLDVKANREYGGSLPIPVTFLLDEFANISKIPNFQEILAYARSLNIGIVPILQSLNQLKKMYEKDWEAILDNCDTTIFLGGQGQTTTKYFSEWLGKTTIDLMAQNKSYGQQKSTSLNESKLGRNLLAPEELARMDVGKCIVFVKGLNPFMDDKYPLESHKNYKQTGDYDKSKKYIHERAVIKFDLNYGEKISTDDVVKITDIEQEAEEIKRNINLNKQEQKSTIDNVADEINKMFTDEFIINEVDTEVNDIDINNEELQEQFINMSAEELQDYF